MPQNKDEPSKKREDVREVEAEIVGMEVWAPKNDESPEEFELDEFDHESGQPPRYYRVQYHSNGCGCCGCLPFVALAVILFFFFYGVMSFFGR
jgi:hypothetical protein